MVLMYLQKMMHLIKSILNVARNEAKWDLAKEFAHCMVLVLFSFVITSTCLFLSCSISSEYEENAWLIYEGIILLYILSCIPLLIGRCAFKQFQSTPNACKTLVLCHTSGCILLSFGLPVALALSKTIPWFSCSLIALANLTVYATKFWLIRELCKSNACNGRIQTENSDANATEEDITQQLTLHKINVIVT